MPSLCSVCLSICICRAISHERIHWPRYLPFADFDFCLPNFSRPIHPGIHVLDREPDLYSSSSNRDTMSWVYFISVRRHWCGSEPKTDDIHPSPLYLCLGVSVWMMRFVGDAVVSTIPKRHPGILRMLTHPFPEDMSPMRGVQTDQSRLWCHVRRSELIRWC